MEKKKDLIGQLKYNKEGLIPAIVQDESTGEILMLAYMNELSLKKTLQTKQTCFYSRSRKKLWVKGESSGNIQKVKQILVDCDNDTLLIKVEQEGAACHTGNYSCFYQDLNDSEIKTSSIPMEKKKQKNEQINILDELSKIFDNRKKNPNLDSYVCRLMSSPGEKMPKKIGEEAAEVIIALKDNDKNQIIYETADLWFHTLVALSYYDIPYQAILEELKRRRK